MKKSATLSSELKELEVTIQAEIVHIVSSAENNRIELEDVLYIDVLNQKTGLYEEVTVETLSNGEMLEVFSIVCDQFVSTVWS